MYVFYLVVEIAVLNLMTSNPKYTYMYPIEIWDRILAYTDLHTISTVQCANRLFYNMIHPKRYQTIDRLHDDIDVLIPMTYETFLNYRYCIEWRNIILRRNLGKPDRKIPESVIRWIPDSQDLDVICVYQPLSTHLLREMYTKFTWTTLLYNQRLPLDILETLVTTYLINDQHHSHYSEWSRVWGQECITPEFLDKYIDHVQWHPVSSNKSLVNFDVIDRYGHDLVWQEFTKHGINENVLVNYLHRFDFICWINIAEYTQLSEQFIMDHLEHLDLNIILRYQTISETLLLQLIDKYGLTHFIDWMLFECIGLNQQLSPGFIKEYRPYLPLKILIRNRKIPRTVLQAIYE